MKFLVINGPNINLLGRREPQIYGAGSYAELVSFIEMSAQLLNVEVQCFQSNHEGAIVDMIQAAADAEAEAAIDGIVINPAAFTHTSIAILDAIKAVGIPTVEVHLSDVSKREDYRQRSFVREACIKTVMGQGFEGYKVAMEFLWQRLALGSGN